MSKEALLFPGQGLGAKEVIPFHQKLQNINEDWTRQSLGLAQDVLNETFGYGHFNIKTALKDEEDPQYGQTAFMQLLIHNLNVLGFDLPGKNHASFAAGHSLGEYSAATITGILTREEGLRIVAHRGKFMQEACEESPGKLVSIVGLSEEKVAGIYSDMYPNVEIALINAPKIVVVGCDPELVKEVEIKAKQNHAERVNELNTQGAFHTRRMTGARDKLEEYLGNFRFRAAWIPVVQNLDGLPEFEDEAFGYFKKRLISVMTKPVRWVSVIETMISSLRVGKFVEAGPGNSLAILNRKNGVDRAATRNILD